MKRFFTALVAMTMAVCAHAQFEEGKMYAGASLSGFDLSYNGSKELSLGIQAKAGYMAADNLMVLGEAGFQHEGKGAANAFQAGVGGRYYITQNGIFLGANCKFVHASHNYNDLMPGVEVGYAFFISHMVTIEPSIYYQQSFKKHSDYSTIGLKLGFGIYL